MALRQAQGRPFLDIRETLAYFTNMLFAARHAGRRMSQITS
ncbi:MAG TPA: hypothetical protein VGY77_01480 [Gemmataceae bacterium]|nr:hypothetical protein [Gemmataceae bacterium]